MWVLSGFQSERNVTKRKRQPKIMRKYKSPIMLGCLLGYCRVFKDNQEMSDAGLIN